LSNKRFNKISLDILDSDILNGFTPDFIRRFISVGKPGKIGLYYDKCRTYYDAYEPKPWKKKSSLVWKKD
jgi:hypothetical protein